MDQQTQPTQPQPQADRPLAEAASTPAATQMPTTPPTQTQPETHASTAPASSTPPSADPPKQGSHKGLFIVAGIVLLLAALGGAAYLLLQNESTTEVSQVQIQSTKPRYKSPTATPSAMPIEGTVEEVEAVTIDDGSSDTTELQTDIDQL